MKWSPEDCSFGDIIRTKVGSVYHYGIFVSEQEVIQFGFAPNYYVGEHKGEKIQVCSTDIYKFMMGGVLEKGLPDKAEKKKMLPPQKIVQTARARIGEDGYNILHNNCEHFVNECAFGKKYSEQEELLRKKWNGRPKFDVYLSFEDLNFNYFVPRLREKEIAFVKNDKVQTDKKNSWQLLSFALNKSFGYKPEDIKFKKKLNGKWVADCCYFSISHTDGCCAIVVSNAKCGIDVERVSAFEDKFSDEDFKRKFTKFLGIDTCKNLELLKIWTGKESTYKAYLNGRFSPKKCKVSLADTRYIKIKDYLIALTGSNSSSFNVYSVDNKKCKLLLTGEYECL